MVVIDSCGRFTPVCVCSVRAFFEQRCTVSILGSIRAHVGPCVASCVGSALADNWQRKPVPWLPGGPWEALCQQLPAEHSNTIATPSDPNRGPVAALWLLQSKSSTQNNVRRVWETVECRQHAQPSQEDSEVLLRRRCLGPMAPLCDKPRLAAVTRRPCHNL